MRILQIGLSASAGGIESFIMNVYKNIDRDKIQFDFVDWNSYPMYYTSTIEKMGGKIYRIPSRRNNYFKHLSELKKIISKKQYRIIYNHVSSWSYTDAIRISLGLGKKTVVHSHNSAISGDNIPTIILNAIHKNRYKKNKQLIKFACGEMAGRWLYGNNDFKVIPNGISTDNYKFNLLIREKLRKHYNISADVRVFGHVGRFSKSKNHKYLIQLFKGIHDLDKKTCLILVGDGELRKKIEHDVVDLNLGKSVIFLGVKNNVNEILNMFDCFILPSFHEGFPVTLVEAQASGLQCFVSSRVSKEAALTSLVDFFDTGENARKNADYIIKKLKYVDRTGYSGLIKSKGYDIKDVAKKLENFYLSEGKNEDN